MTVSMSNPTLLDKIVGLVRAQHADLRAWIEAMTPEEREIYWAAEARKIRATPEWREYQLAKGREP